MSARREERKRWRCMIVIALALTASLGCKNLYRFPSAQESTVDSHGRVWLAGSEGFAAVWEGSSLQRQDYANPALLEEPLYRAGLSRFAAARVVEVGTSLQLVTRAGDRYRHTGGRWQRAPLELGGSGALRGQINFAAEHDGKLLLYVNDGRLLWVDPVGGNVVREEPLYGLVDHMAVHGDALVGIGYRGAARTLVRRVGKTRWEELARFAERVTVLALARMADRWVVVLRRGVVTVRDDGVARFIHAKVWSNDAAQSAAAGVLPEGVPLASTSRDDIPQAIGMAITAPGVIVIPMPSRMIVLSAGDSQAPLTWFAAAPCEGIRQRPFPIPVHGPVARLRDARIVMATGSAKLYALGEGTCTQLSPALVDW